MVHRSPPVRGSQAQPLRCLALRPLDAGEGAITLMSGRTVWACVLEGATNGATATAGAAEMIAVQPRHS